MSYGLVYMKLLYIITLFIYSRTPFPVFFSIVVTPKENMILKCLVEKQNI